MAKYKKRYLKEDDIDLESNVVAGLLKQIKNEKKFDEDKPPLMTVWCCIILPNSTRDLLSFIRQFVTPYEEQSFVHIKRFTKKESQDANKVNLAAVVCSCQLYDKKQLMELFDQFSKTNPIDIMDLFPIEIPSESPINKEASLKLSKKYWPMSWKGNPNHQFLKEVDFNMQEEQRMIQELLRAVQLAPDKSNPYTTIIAKSINDCYHVLVSGYDKRSIHPLKHSVMDAIEKMALAEKEKRQSDAYLCQDAVVFTTHEPCPMCCMALIHSRIKRIVYMKDSPISGALGTNYQIGDRSGLNWKFEIWKWLGAEQIHQLIDITGEQELANV